MTKEREVFTLLDEAGVPVDFTLVDVVEVNQRRYAVLRPVAEATEQEEDAAVVFRVEEDILVAIDDEAEIERVVDALEATETYEDITLIDG